MALPSEQEAIDEAVLAEAMADVQEELQHGLYLDTEWCALADCFT